LGFHTKNDGITLIMAFFTSLFSFLLLLIFLLLFLTNKVLSLFQESSILSFSTGLLILWVWMVYYFFRHTIFYHETRLISFLKSSFLFLINFIIIIMLSYFLYLYQSKITPKKSPFLILRRHYHAVALKLPNQLIILILLRL
jgi:hypothetical protein